jgi:hypothetical protein
MVYGHKLQAGLIYTDKTGLLSITPEKSTAYGPAVYSMTVRRDSTFDVAELVENLILDFDNCVFEFAPVLEFMPSNIAHRFIMVTEYANHVSVRKWYIDRQEAEILDLLPNPWYTGHRLTKRPRSPTPESPENKKKKPRTEFIFTEPQGFTQVPPRTEFNFGPELQGFTPVPRKERNSVPEHQRFVFGSVPSPPPPPRSQTSYSEDELDELMNQKPNQYGHIAK